MSIESGETFPSFTAQSQEGEAVSLEGYRGNDSLVVFFYPRANTSGCVKETTEFSVRREEFDALGAKLVGISVDDVRWQQKHAIQCATNFPLLSDKDKALTSQLGILGEHGMAQRTTYLLDRDGVVRRVFTNVNVESHVDDVLHAVKELEA